jgi:MFS family permease
MLSAFQYYLHRYPREALLFLLASFVNAAGSAFMWPLTTLYVHTQLHRTMAEAGFVLMLQSLAGIAGQFAGGALFHRLGAKRLIVGSLLFQAVIQLAIVFTAGWSGYITLMVGLGFLFNVSQPAIHAFIGFRWKEQRRELFNVVYVGNNLGMAIGTSLAGVIASVSFGLTFLANSLSTFVFALFFLLFLRRMSHRDLVGLAPELAGKHGRFEALLLLLRYRVYLFMALGAALIWFSTSVWSSGIAPYLAHQGMSLAAYSFLWTVNGIVIFAGQPVTSWLKRVLNQSLPAQLVASAALYAGGFAFISLFHTSYYAIVAGMVITTFGEMLIAPTIPAFVTEKTGEAAPFYLGVVGAISSVGRLLGPLVMGSMFDLGGAVPTILLAAAMSAVSVLLCLIHASFHRSKPVTSVASSNR